MQRFFPKYILRDIAGIFRDVILPPKCPMSACALPCTRDAGMSICESCYYRFHRLRAESRECYQSIDAAYSYTVYAGEAKAIIHTLKWTLPEYGYYLADLMYMGLNELQLGEFDVILAVPSEISAERPWSPSHILASSIAHRMKVPYSMALTKIHSTKLTQAKSRSDRANILKNAIQYQNILPHGIRRVLLVDDLVASGLSLEACATLIRQNHPNCEIIAYTFASSSE